VIYRTFDHPQNDIPTNLQYLRTLLSELDILKQLCNHRVHMISPSCSSDSPDPFENLDVEINLLVKCYMFVLRQTIQRVFRLVFLLRVPLKFDKVRSPICDASKDEKFSDFIEGISCDRYEYDKEILFALNKAKDIFIVARMLRNSIKSLPAPFYVMVTNGHDIMITCPLNKQQTEDKLLQYLSWRKWVEYVQETMFLTLPGRILSEAVSTLTEIADLVENKLGD